MARRRRAERFHINAEINVVNLIDVMLLLMVIFMLTAPMMQGGVDVQLPRAASRPLDATRGLIVTVLRDGQIAIGEARMTYEEFVAAFPAIAEREGGVERGVYVRGDEGAPYGSVLRVVAAMKEAGVSDVGLVAEPEPAR